MDHGKAFLSAHVISVCTRLGITISPAQPKKPTDKPTVEVVEVVELPMTHMPTGAVQVKVRAVGDLAPAGGGKP